MDQNATVAVESRRAGSEVPEFDVAIVGGGPTGLMLAAELVRRGVRFVLFERRSSPDRLGRANDIHGRMQVLDQHGLAGAVASGLPMRRSIIMFDRQPVADSGRAKDRGVIAHRFYGADGQILVVDEWPDPELRGLLPAGAVEHRADHGRGRSHGEPKVAFWRKLETGDDVGSD